MENEKVFAMSFSKVYGLLIAKAERKGRTREEVEEVTSWLTGYTAQQIDELMDSEISYGDFFRQAPAMNPNREKITGVVCGVRVENIERIEILYHKYNLQSWKKVLSYVTERLKAVLREEPGKEKDMFTIISKFYLNSELKHEALHAYEQGYDAVRLDQMKHYCDLCRKRRE